MGKVVKVEKGQIRKPNKRRRTIMKVISPDVGEMLQKDEGSQQVDIYILTMEFPQFHYVVIEDIIDSVTAKGVMYCVVHLITHSDGFENLKVTNDLYYSNIPHIDLNTSYISRDKFLVALDDIKLEESYGQFYLDKLLVALVY